MKIGRRKKWKMLIFAVLFVIVVVLSIGTASVATHYVNSCESNQVVANAASAGGVMKSGTCDENIYVTGPLAQVAAEISSGRPVIAGGHIIVNDSISDVPYDFIDIKQGMISINETSLIVNIHLVNIPNQLLFDKENVTDYSIEYEWSLYIDADNDTLTGCPFVPIGVEYAISCINFKYPEDSPHYDSVINGTELYFWEYNPANGWWDVNWSYDVSADVNYDINTLTLIATPFNSALFNTSMFYIVTGYNSGGSSFENDFAPSVPQADISVFKKEMLYLSLNDAHLDCSDICNFTKGWDVTFWEMEDLDNVTLTITTPRDLIYIDNWELYQNGTDQSFNLPSTVEGQNYTWFIPLEDRLGSVINFILDSPQSVQNNSWVELDVNRRNENGYTRVIVTFTPVIPLGWVGFDIRADEVIEITTYPSEFEPNPYTSSYIEFCSGEIEQNQTYDFSILVEDPESVYLNLERPAGEWLVEPPSDTITLAVAELGNVTASADAPVTWGHEEIQPILSQEIYIEFEEVSTPNVSIRSKQDFMERKYVANGSFSSSLSDMTYRLDLRIYANSGQFVVPRVVIFNTTSINLDRTFYKVDGVSMDHGNITAFPDHIEWAGNNETVSSYFELGIYELNTHKLTPPFSSSRSVEKEVFDGNETIKMTFNATPTDNLSQLDFLTFTEETNDAYSEFLVDTATNSEFIEELSSDMIEWEFDDPVIGQTYSASVNLTVTPKTASTTRYWTYLKVEGDYGSYTNSTSGSNQSMVEYTDSILGDVQIYFENPVNYTIDANGKGTYYERFRAFSEIVEYGEPNTVGITLNAFKPGVRTVTQGTTVMWMNKEDLVHTVTSDTGLWDSGYLSRGQSFSYNFTELGSYYYHDALHPSVTGVVIVQESDVLPVHTLDTGKNFSTIQAAINDPTTLHGHTITVDPGTYVENVNVNKQLTIRSTSGNPADTLVHAANPNDHIFEVTADFVNISGFTVANATGNGKAGIYLNNEEHCVITGNIVTENYIGISLVTSSNNNISFNSIHKNTNAGISLSSSNYNNLTYNAVCNTTGTDGIRFSSSHYNQLAYNTISMNAEEGIQMSYCRNNTIVHNTVNNNSAGGGILLHRASHDNLVQANIVSDNEHNGINVNRGSKDIYELCENITIKDNIVYGTDGTGITIDNLTFSMIENNTIFNNTDAGIRLRLSRYNTLVDNNLSNNGINLLLDPKFDSLEDYNNSIDTSNLVNGLPAYYYFNKSDLVLDNLNTKHITVAGCTNVTIRNNNVSNGDPFRLAYTTNSLVKDNVASNNFVGIFMSSCVNTTIVDNIVNHNKGWGGISLVRSSLNNTIDNNTVSYTQATGFVVRDSHNNKIINNTLILNNGDGIWLNNSNSNLISGNNASNNLVYNGISLRDSRNNEIVYNNANLNHHNGICLYLNDTNNTVAHNIVNWNSDHGIYFNDSNNNTIYNNYFENANNAHDNGNNIWNTSKTAGTNIIGGSLLGGNYWSDYAGEDLDGDGLGDTLLPYNSSGNIQNGGDYLPLVRPTAPSVFDTGKGTYPSIMGTHNGTITSNVSIEVSKLYTYPCLGTGGHTEYVRIYNESGTLAEGHWNGYVGDYHNITLTPSITLYKDHEYNYTIKTGSYPQIIHETSFNATGGTITCDKFIDANGKVYYDWIPAIRLWGDKNE